MLLDCARNMAAFKDIQLNAIEKKTLMKQADDLYRSTNCECLSALGDPRTMYQTVPITYSLQRRGGEIAIQVSLPQC